MAEASDLSPISLTLNDYRVTLDNGQWTSDYPDDGRTDHAPPSGAMEKEVIRLRNDKRRLMRDLEKFKRQAREMDELKERWSNLDFKYQLLMDMWTLKQLDTEKQESSRAHSPTSNKNSPRAGTPP
ncbi:hypothetical protein SELMODRAFT_417494 [Selaginella moellendorffii]|uniref:Uncharacterized protein n=1 Tax=Selaginella moellendorffii TaxID=88036 RepID=D8S2E6_SELML|nr:hypothetical protein SELMODRAFT_417494 [Selaginella moellendorffii]